MGAALGGDGGRDTADGGVALLQTCRAPANCAVFISGWSAGGRCVRRELWRAESDAGALCVSRPARAGRRGHGVLAGGNAATTARGRYRAAAVLGRLVGSAVR